MKILEQFILVERERQKLFGKIKLQRVQVFIVRKRNDSLPEPDVPTPQLSCRKIVHIKRGAV